MRIKFKTSYFIILFAVLITAFIFSFNYIYSENSIYTHSQDNTLDEAKEYIKWVDFDVTTPAMQDAMKVDISSQNEEIKIDWIKLLAILGNKYGGDFSKYKKSDLTEIVENLNQGKTIEELTSKLKNYSYYYEIYNAVLCEFVGEYQIETPTKNNPEVLVWENKYGLKAFSPIAKTYPYSDSDDFGNSRSYGFKRRHLGHDMFASTGTPVVSIESGTVEIMGWNQYGGWRIGIRSFDKKRYYYYAHLRKNRPYSEDLYEGKVVKAGDVIGYVGQTGYSSEENVNNIDVSHLHVGLQLIFDESQKEGKNEIWIDMYSISNLLSKNRCEVKRDDNKEYRRLYDFDDITNID